ncbi:MAG: winged helix-turn-helix transcriptional regulator, partial [Rhizobacter sp.]|nr:winged helix-turn-helix transcriptional regulator [Rhizobacter sp.]
LHPAKSVHSPRRATVSSPEAHGPVGADGVAMTECFPLSARAPPAPPAAAAPSAKMAFDAWLLDPAARRLTHPLGHDVALTSGEFDLLCVFVRHSGRVLSRDFLLEQTRGREAGPFDRTVDVQVGRLRKKLEADPEAPQIIKSVRSAGYVFVPIVGAA